MNFGGKFIYEDDASPSKYHTLCERMIAKLLRNIILISSAILIAHTLAGCGTLYAIVLHGDRITFLATEMAFVDGSTVTGFVINMMEQLLLIFISLTSNFANEIGVCLVHNAFEAIPEVIHLDSEELKTELNLNGVSLNARMRLRNIFMKVQDFNG